MMLHRKTAALVAALLTMTALTGCGGKGAAGAAAAKTDPSAEIALSSGPDRQQMLETGAQAEKKLMWYTTTIPEQISNPLATAFEKKYPWADVEIYRANSTDVTAKVQEEYQAGSHFVDVVDGTGTAVLLEQMDAIQPFTSPSLAEYDDASLDPDGYSGPQLLYFMVMAYNTNEVPADEAPKTYEDLLDPKWKGRMTWSTSPTSGGPLFIGNIMTALGTDKGTEYLDELAANGMVNGDQSGRAALDTVISGQNAIGVQLFNDQVEDAKSQGAPVDWNALDPATGQYSRAALAKFPPHPHMAMLFLDFMFSKEGQEVIRDGNGIPAHPEVAALIPELKPEQGGFSAQFPDPEQIVKQTQEWSDLFEEKFRG